MRAFNTRPNQQEQHSKLKKRTICYKAIWFTQLNEYHKYEKDKGQEGF